MIRRWLRRRLHAIRVALTRDVQFREGQVGSHMDDWMDRDDENRSK